MTFANSYIYSVALQMNEISLAAKEVVVMKSNANMNRVQLLFLSSFMLILKYCAPILM